MKKRIIKLSVMLSGLAVLLLAQTIPFTGMFPIEAYSRVLHQWGPVELLPDIGAGAYCPPSQSLIGVSTGASTSCDGYITIDQGAGKYPSDWRLYTTGNIYEAAFPQAKNLETWFEWTSCDVLDATIIQYDNYPQQC